MLSRTFGNPCMDLRDLVHAAMKHDALVARQWVADAARSGLEWSKVPRPSGLDQTEMAVAAGLAEMLADRARQAPPDWAASVLPAPEPVWLVRAAASMPRL